jgi:hypothetical protein
MRKTFILLVLLSVTILMSCKKDDSGKELNTLTVTEGDFKGYTHIYSPNLGFWSPVDETTRYVHLVLGDDDNQSNGGENVMSIVFYENGSVQVAFPSPEGQWARFGMTYEGVYYNFIEESAILTITQIDDINFAGTLTGTFVDISDSSKKISFTMYVSLPMQQI